VVAVILEWPLPILILQILATFSLLISDFSVFYVSLGTKHNFNIPLTRLDALYFTIGTLTTAGTGNIVATSESVRRIQAIQMGLDFLLIAVAITLVLAKLSTMFKVSRSEPTQEEEK
jgi:hypothetical protein